MKFETRHESGDGTLRYRLGDYEVAFSEEMGRQHITMRHHIYAEGAQIATHVKHTIDDRKQVDETLYYHRDPLGSTLMVTDNLKRIRSAALYAPYGERIALHKDDKVDSSELPGFTGHTAAGTSGLIDMKARLYDPAIGRFLMPDSIIPDATSTAGFNRYAYVYSNPLKYVDPDGHNPLMFFFGAVIYTIGATSDDPFIQKAGMLMGGLMMTSGMAGTLGNPIAEGAVVSFSRSVLSGQGVGQIFRDTIAGGLSAGFASGLPEAFGTHGWNFGLALSHGMTQGMISALRGGDFKTGFISAFASKLSGAMIAEMGMEGANPLGEATIAALFGGMASAASGGDFAEGALTAMVVYLYNDVYADMMAEKAAFGRVRKGSLLKNAAKGGKDLAEGVASVPKAMYAYGDHLAKYTGFRDWQKGNLIPWNKMETRMKVYLFNKAIQNTAIRNKMIAVLQSDIKAHPMKYIGSTITPGFLHSAAGIGMLRNFILSSQYFPTKVYGSVVDATNY